MFVRHEKIGVVRRAGDGQSLRVAGFAQGRAGPQKGAPFPRVDASSAAHPDRWDPADKPPHSGAVQW